MSPMYVSCFCIRIDYNMAYGMLFKGEKSHRGYKLVSSFLYV